MPKFSEAIERGKQYINKVIDDHAEDLERGWNNREEDEHFKAGLILKFLPKDGGKNIKVEAHIGFDPEKPIKDSVEGIVSDQLSLPDGEEE